MKKSLFASAALIALITGGPAIAAEMGIGPPAPAYTPVNDWTGFYLGGHAGYGWGHDPFNDASQQFSAVPVALNGVDPKGFVGGGHFGYNQQWGNWVGGLEIDISGSAIKGSAASSATGSVVTFVPVFPFVGVAPFTNTVSQSDSFDLLGSARARLGGLVWADTLLYGTGGLAWTRFVGTTTRTQTTATQPVSVTSSVVENPLWMFGWVAGVGGETKIYSSNWLFRVEYLHYDFGDRGGNTTTFVNGGVITTAGITTGHLTADVVRAGISYKFGGNPI
jgi:outer membrane immunogenic protein